MLGFGLSIGIPLVLTVVFLVWARGQPERIARRPPDWRPRSVPSWVLCLGVVISLGIGWWDLSDHHYFDAGIIGAWAAYGIGRPLRRRPSARRTRPPALDR